tara:strand:+ start:272 stop:517 length:246 start_codon:yes stop_codon:yes gene_type:complete
MNYIDIDTSKSYATYKNLDKGTQMIDHCIESAMNAREIGQNEVRKMQVRNSEGRYTAAYFLSGSGMVYAAFIASKGFKVIG